MTNPFASDRTVKEIYGSIHDYAGEDYRLFGLIAELEAAIRAEVRGSREALAALEHEQWETWSRNVADSGLTETRIERWHQYWVPYEELSEEVKDFDRVWADRVLEILDKK